jgi:hypothetical protein
MAIEPIVAHGNVPEVFELVEAPFHEIALLVDLLVVTDVGEQSTR